MTTARRLNLIARFSSKAAICPPAALRAAGGQSTAKSLSERIAYAMNKKQKTLLWRIIIAAIFWVPLFLISEEIIAVELPKWALIILLLGVVMVLFGVVVAVCATMRAMFVVMVCHILFFFCFRMQR